MVPVSTTMDTSIQGLFNTLRESLESAAATAPTYADITPPPDGISLLDVKSELLLSYLHNLVFLILLKIRQRHSGVVLNEGGLSDEVVKQLVELRVYLEKGVRPLEGRLKYQIDKVLRAADDADRKESGVTQKLKAGPRRGARAERFDTNEEEEFSQDGGSVTGDDSDAGEEMDELSFRPNPAAMLKSAAGATATASSAKQPSSNSNTSRNGVYKPPRIAATAMPTSRPQREERRPQRSTAVDEYINSELSTAPTAEPSIGSTIVAGGRRTKSDRERADEAERRNYEESNFVRLPKETKAERAKRNSRGREHGGRDEEFGASFGAGLDRIDRLTQKKGGRGTKLDSSRKRAVEDGPRDDGLRAGDLFAKRRKMDSRRNRR